MTSSEPIVNPGAGRELWDAALVKSGIDPAGVTEYNVPDELVGPDELAARRASVMNNRADLDLEGLAPVAEITELEEQYMCGKLTAAEFREGCFAYAKSIAPNKNWQPLTGAVQE